MHGILQVSFSSLKGGGRSIHSLGGSIGSSTGMAAELKVERRPPVKQVGVREGEAVGTGGDGPVFHVLEARRVEEEGGTDGVEARAFRVKGRGGEEVENEGAMRRGGGVWDRSTRMEVGSGPSWDIETVDA